MGILPGRGRLLRTRIIVSALLLGSGLAAAVSAASGGQPPAPTARTRVSPERAQVLAARAAASPARKTAAATAGSAAARPTGLLRADLPGGTGAGAAPAGYAPADLRSAYNLVSAAASGGTGATVAIIGAYDDPNAASDLAAYREHYGLPACTVANGCFREVNENGQPSPLPASYGTAPDPWATDESLDLDMVSAICPNCHILLVEASSQVITDTGPAVDAAVALGARFVVFDPAGSGTSADDKYFDQPGVAITAPAGDRGFLGSGVAYPAASQFVTAVGGTTLTPSSDSRGWTETVWGPPSGPSSPGATESGCSHEGKPSWQTDTGCPVRTGNDVSAVANPDTGVAFYDSYEGTPGWAVGGGTTVAAAIVGAVYALAGTPAPDTFPVTYPYLHTAGLYPVTSGTDSSRGCTPSYLCTAGPGYNGPAGWGTPDGTSAFTFGPRSTDYVVMAGLFPSQDLVPLPHAISAQPIALDSAPAQALTYRAANLPPGVSIDPATGLISGTITRAYSGTITITASDPTGASASASLTVKAANPISLQLPGTRQTKPDTAVSLQLQGSDITGQTLTYSAAGLPPGLTINPQTGLISGTTTSTIASYPVTATVTDTTNSTASVTFTWKVWNLVRVTVPIEHFTVGTAVSVRATATDSAPGQTLTYAMYGGSALPPGLTLDPATGLISGTPTTLGLYSGVIQATDGTGSSGVAGFNWAVAGKIEIYSPGTLSTGAGQPVSQDLEVTDSAAGDTLTYSMSGAPPGLAILGSPPVISGWTETPGRYTVKVSAADEYGGGASVTFPWTVPAAADTGPTGPIRLNWDGKCLDDTGNSSANGNKIQIWTCIGDAAQRWTMARDGTIRIHGKCLDVTGRSTASGAKLQLWACNGGLNQAWVPSQYATGGLQGVASRLCLTDPGESMRNGTQLEIYGCGAGVLLNAQQWTVPAGSLLLGVAGKCADDWGGYTTNGNPIQVYTCNGDKAQAWTFEPDGTVRVVGKCLTWNTPGSGGAVYLSACQPPDGDQQWAPAPFDRDIGFGLAAGGPVGGYCLSDPGASTRNGTRLKLAPCSRSDAGSSLHFW